MNRKGFLKHWELGIILGGALGIPGMLVGGMIASTRGPGEALVSVLIGNLLLWVIGISVIAMSGGTRNAVGNVTEYLGKPGSLVYCFIITGAFICWYSIQIDLPTELLVSALHKNTGIAHGLHLRTGSTIGLICALLSIGGLKTIRWASLISVPIILLSQLYLITQSELSTKPWTFSLSASSIAFVVLSWLPGSVNLPTFYKHAGSKNHAFIGLSVMTILHIFFNLFAIFLNIGTIQQFSLNSSNHIMTICIVLFSLASVISVNLANVYFAAAGWDTIFPERFQKSKKYAIIGLLGTIVYAFLQKENYMVFGERVLSSWIASLTTVLLLSFLEKAFIRHRPKIMEKATSSFCWLIGGIVAVWTESQHPSSPAGSSPALEFGIYSVCISYLIIAFVEETIWSIKIAKNNG